MVSRSRLSESAECVGDSAVALGERNLLDQSSEQGAQHADRVFERHVDDRRRYLRRHEGIAVAVTANPRTKGQGATVDAKCDVETAEAFDELGEHVGDGTSHQPIDEVEGVSRLVEDFGLLQAKLVGEP